MQFRFHILWCVHSKYSLRFGLNRCMKGTLFKPSKTCRSWQIASSTNLTVGETMLYMLQWIILLAPQLWCSYLFTQMPSYTVYSSERKGRYEKWIPPSLLCTATTIIMCLHTNQLMHYCNVMHLLAPPLTRHRTYF